MTIEPFKATSFASFNELEAFNNQIYCDPYGSDRANSTYRATLYRGQADSEWGLIPSLFRDFASKDNIPLSQVREAYEREYAIVADFVLEADAMGSPIEFGFSEFLTQRRLNENTWRFWAETDDTAEREHIALAQHYGARTRYVDFTDNFLVSVFFAAHDAFELISHAEDIDVVSSKSFSVWMFDPAFLIYQSYKGDRFDFEEVRTPRARNPFLRAQGGRFLTPKIRVEGKETFLASDFDLKESIITSAIKVADDGEGSKPIWPILRRLDLPYAQAADCLVHLENRGISLRTIRPSLENIVASFNFSQRVRKWISDQIFE